MQIENEFGPVEWDIGAPGKAYAKWAAQMAVGLNTGVPWVMCKQDDAPDPVVSNSLPFFFSSFAFHCNFSIAFWYDFLHCDLPFLVRFLLFNSKLSI